VFRILLFSDTGFMRPFRDAALYTDTEGWVDNDYFLLFCRFEPGRCAGSDSGKAHPILGWGGDFDLVSYLHRDADSVGSRRPVLLYGDSFAACALLSGQRNEAQCFQGLLNPDPEFSRNHFLLNYGVGAYGLDQIYRLIEHSVDRFANPFVIVSLMTWDLDRSVVTNRTGVKPYADVVDGRLVLRAPPTAEPSGQQGKPQLHIVSYLCRLWLYHDGRLTRLRNQLRGVHAKQHYKMVVSGALLEEIVNRLRQRGVEFIFLVFYPAAEVPNDDGWRQQFLEGWLQENGVPYLTTQPIVRQHMATSGRKLRDYYIPDDGHPTLLQNEIVAAALKETVLKSVR